MQPPPTEAAQQPGEETLRRALRGLPLPAAAGDDERRLWLNGQTFPTAREVTTPPAPGTTDFLAPRPTTLRAHPS